MLSKRIIIMGMLTATLFTPITFAASANQAGDTAKVTEETRAVRRANRGDRYASRTNEMKEFYTEYQKSENELFEKLPEMSREEAEAAIDKFYNEKFAKMPSRSNPTKDNIIKTIDGMDIPHDLKSEIEAKINSVSTTQHIRMKERAISFAKSLIDMPEDERQEDIEQHNIRNERRFNRMFDRKHHNRTGMRGKGGMQGMMQGRGRMQGMGNNKIMQCPMMQMMMNQKAGKGRMQGMGGDDTSKGMQGTMDEMGMMCPMMKMTMNSQEGGRHHKFKKHNTHNDRKFDHDKDNNDEVEEDHNNDAE